MTSRAQVVLTSKALRERAHDWINKAPTGTRIDFKGPRRSVIQNDRMWAMLTDVATQKTHAGRRFTTDEWKVLFMHACGRQVQFLPALDGGAFVPYGQMMVAALYVETDGAYTGLPMLTRGTSAATPGSTPARIRSWPIRPASAGAGSGTALRASRISSSSAPTMAALPRRWPLCGAGAASWSIPAIATPGRLQSQSAAARRRLDSGRHGRRLDVLRLPGPLRPLAGKPTWLYATALRCQNCAGASANSACTRPRWRSTATRKPAASE
jgi:hypothetical protein